MKLAVIIGSVLVIMWLALTTVSWLEQSYDVTQTWRVRCIDPARTLRESPDMIDYLGWPCRLEPYSWCEMVQRQWYYLRGLNVLPPEVQPVVQQPLAPGHYVVTDGVLVKQPEPLENHQL